MKQLKLKLLEKIIGEMVQDIDLDRNFEKDSVAQEIKAIIDNRNA